MEPDPFSLPSHGSTATRPVPDDSESTRAATFPGLPPRLVPGDSLGPYRIQGEIAVRTRSAVYRAFDLRHGHEVALKVLSPHLATVPAALRKFRDEFRIAQRVRHPGIVVVIEEGQTCGLAFYSMRLERHNVLASLGSWRESTSSSSPWARLASMFAEAARALAVLHASGIVHRDIKPANFLLGEDGRLILSDFGSATVRSRPGDSAEDSFWGTVRYLPPEQFRPGADRFDPRIDIYGFGVTLYEAFTGTSPFPRQDDQHLVHWKLNRLPPPARSVRAEVPLSLDAAIRRAMDPNPELRYAEADDLASDLERFAGA